MIEKTSEVCGDLRGLVIEDSRAPWLRIVFCLLLRYNWLWLLSVHASHWMAAKGKESMRTSVIGQSLPRIDARAKVTGEARYPGDFYMEGMLHAKVVWSEHSHAL